MVQYIEHSSPMKIIRQRKKITITEICNKGIVSLVIA